MGGSVWIFRISSTIWKACRNAYRMVPVSNGGGGNGGELELKTGIRISFPHYSATDVVIDERTGRHLIPWAEGTQLDISELNIDLKSRG